jgi:hypothetical protein
VFICSKERVYDHRSDVVRHGVRAVDTVMNVLLRQLKIAKAIKVKPFILFSD